MKPRRTPRWTRLITATVLAGVVAAGCGATDNGAEAPTPTDSPDASGPTATEPERTDPVATEPEVFDPRMVSVEEGAAARVRYEPLRQSADAASAMVIAGDPATDCGISHVPTPEEIAESNAPTSGLVEAFDRFGVAYTSSTDDTGYLIVDYDDNDVVAQSVADSYWHAAYPPSPISQEELDTIVAQNDILAEQLDAAAVTYQRTTDDSGYETIEYDDDDPTAQAAADAAWLIIYPPEPPTPEQLALQNDDNQKLMAAFDEAGIAYELVADELGWAWLEWDYDDPATAEQYFAIVDALYPPIAIDPIVECPFIDEQVAIDTPTLDATPVEPVDAPAPIDGVEVLPIDDGPTPEETAQRSTEVAAMANGFTTASVEFEQVGESQWQTVVFDLDNDSAAPVIAAILAARA